MSPSFSNKSLTSRRCLPEVLCGISSRFQLLSPTEFLFVHVLLIRSPLSHPSFLTEISKVGASFDLHVLGMPPAFILSQDQTLNKLYLSWLSQLKPIHRNFNLFQNKSQNGIELCFQSEPAFHSGSFSSSLFLVLKAFKLFLHCLIFKVHRGALSGVAGSAALLFYHIRFRLSRTFFKFFLKRPSEVVRSHEWSYIVSHSVQLVKNFFRRIFQRSSSLFLSLALSSRPSRDSLINILLCTRKVKHFLRVF